ncbi:CLUMA_CG014660, isoform A [Clunio marinus]|uniref:CLUMA_CG014660, isoform A n=1 Tax=Clunio marinus TaxID=568069 RepID=A0A1J1ILS1_9DIPT|nr:CLUMA_CG014660, isoform A [Clunio marinus]
MTLACNEIIAMISENNLKMKRILITIQEAINSSLPNQTEHFLSDIVLSHCSFDSSQEKSY